MCRYVRAVIFVLQFDLATDEGAEIVHGYSFLFRDEAQRMRAEVFGAPMVRGN